MSKIKITEQDVGREYIARNGYKYKIAKFGKGEKYPVSIGCLNISGYIGLTENGHGNFDGRESQLDFMHWADEGEKMENKIKLKVGRKVRFRNGKTGEVIWLNKGNKLIQQPFRAYINEDEECWYYTKDGKWNTDDEASEFDIVEILEEPKNEEVKENKGKFELSITVNDINNSCKNDKYYFTESLDLPLGLRGLVADNFSLYQLLTNTETLSNKNDTFKFSKIIKLNGKELGKITIRVTQLTD